MQKDRLYNILTSDNIEESIQNNLSYLLEIIPELKDMIDFPHNHPHHHLDVWNHTLYALSLSKRDFDVRLAKDGNYYIWSESFLGLLADIKKIESSNPWA